MTTRPLPIGFHFGSSATAAGYGDYVRALDAAGIPAVLMSVGGEGFGDIAACWDAGSTVDHLAVVRCLSDNDVPLYDAPIDTAVNDWLGRYVPTIGGDVKKHHQRVITKHGNELDKNHIAWLADFYTALHPALLARMSWQSHRIACFSFASGEPEPEQWETILPFIELAGNNPDKFVFSLHEYSYNVGNIWAGDGHLVGRFKQLYDICDAHGIKRPFVVSHEWGWEENEMPSTEQAMSDIDAVAALYASYPTYLGAGIWTLQKWHETNYLSNKVQKLIEPIKQLALSKRYEVNEENPPVSESTEEKIYDLSQSWAFPVNQEAALQKAALADGFTPSGEEQWHTVDGTRYAMQPFYRIGSTNDKRSYFAVVGQWGDVHMFPEEELPPGPEPPYIVIPPLSQRDTRWASKLCGTGPKTIGNWGCLLVAYTMLARHWGINNGRLPDAENSHYVSRGGFSGSNLVSMAMSKVYGQVKNEGWLTRDNASMNTKTRDYLSRGIPVPARVDFNPATGQWEQHWVLLVGVDGDNYLMNDPWTGLAGVKVSDYYNISGNDVLECIYYFLDDTPPSPSGQTVDMLPYFSPPAGTPYGPVTIKDTNWGQGQVRQQIQAHGDYLYVTKGKEFEARKLIGDRIFLITDDSPGNGKYYTVQSVDGWIPRHFTEGQSFTRKETATFFYKSNCSATGESSNWSNVIRFTKFYPTWTTPGGLSFNNVCHLQWLVNGVLEEDYWLAPHVGYVMWGNRHGRQSYVVDIPQGQGNNVFSGACYWPAFGKEW